MRRDEGLSAPLWMIVPGAVVLTWLLLNVSPYIDTAFQVEISNESWGGFLGRIVADNQAPAAQFVFWLAGRLGFDGITDQRVVSLLLSSAAYVGAVKLGTLWAEDRDDRLGELLSDRRVVALATGVVIVAGGVMPVSSFVRYASFLGPVWLLAFLLTARAVMGEPRLAFWAGITLGLAGLITYAVVIPAACAFLVLLVYARGAVRRFLTGLGLGLLPTAAWLAYAGADHLSRIVNRVDASDAPTTLRSLVGRAYEVGAWVVVGPASLPSWSGLLLLAVMLGAYAVLTWFAVRHRRILLGVLVGFVVVPIPLLLLTVTASGWGMVGPAATATFVAALGLASFPKRTVAAVVFVGAVLLVSAMPALDIDVLRPGVYSSEAEQAVALGHSRSDTLVVDNWTTEYLAEQDGAEAIYATELPSVSLPTEVVLVFGDPGESAAQTWQAAAYDRLESLGYKRTEITMVGTYGDLALRERLGLVSRPAQYVVESYSQGKS